MSARKLLLRCLWEKLSTFVLQIIFIWSLKFKLVGHLNQVQYNGIITLSINSIMFVIRSFHQILNGNFHSLPDDHPKPYYSQNEIHLVESTNWQRLTVTWLSISIEPAMFCLIMRTTDLIASCRLLMFCFVLILYACFKSWVATKGRKIRTDMCDHQCNWHYYWIHRSVDSSSPLLREISQSTLDERHTEQKLNLEKKEKEQLQVVKSRLLPLSNKVRDTLFGMSCPKMFQTRDSLRSCNIQAESQNVIISLLKMVAKNGVPFPLNNFIYLLYFLTLTRLSDVSNLMCCV